jgi:ubiquinone biosynthesis protein UbiJ
LSATPPDPKATPAVAFCFLANHVLDGAAWARSRLAPFAGKTIEVRAPLLPTVVVGITPQGRLEPGGANAAVTVDLPFLKVSGEPELAAAVEELARTLRWDAEEDLSRVVGDVLAHRAAGAARAVRDWQRDALARLGEAAAGYAVDEGRFVLRRPELAAFADSVGRLARALDELEQRVGRLA